MIVCSAAFEESDVFNSFHIIETCAESKDERNVSKDWDICFVGMSKQRLSTTQLREMGAQFKEKCSFVQLFPMNLIRGSNIKSMQRIPKHEDIRPPSTCTDSVQVRTTRSF